LLASRAGFLAVRAQRHPDRGGYDVVMRIDGTYFGRAELVEMADLVTYWRDAVLEALPADAPERLSPANWGDGS
jgi:hypothetical protein